MPGSAIKEVGRVAVRALPNTKFFRAELKKSLDRIAAFTTLRIKAEVDRTHLFADVRKAVKEAQALIADNPLEIKYSNDTSRVAEALRDANRLANESAKINEQAARDRIKAEGDIGKERIRQEGAANKERIKQEGEFNKERVKQAGEFYKEEARQRAENEREGIRLKAQAAAQARKEATEQDRKIWSDFSKETKQNASDNTNRTSRLKQEAKDLQDWETQLTKLDNDIVAEKKAYEKELENLRAEAQRNQDRADRIRQQAAETAFAAETRAKKRRSAQDKYDFDAEMREVEKQNLERERLAKKMRNASGRLIADPSFDPERDWRLGQHDFVSKQVREVEITLKPTIHDELVRAELRKRQKEITELINEPLSNDPKAAAEQRKKIEQLKNDMSREAISLDVTLNTLGASARLREFTSRLRSLDIEVDANTAKASAKIAAFAATTAAALSGGRFTFNVFSDIGNQLKNLDTALPRITGISMGVGILSSSLITAVGGLASFTQSLGQLLGVAGLIPAALTGMVASISTLLMAASGVGGAIKAVYENEKGGGGVVRNAQVQAKQVEQAQEAIANAYSDAGETQAIAQRRIESANKQASKSIKAANEAIVASQEGVIRASRTYENAVDSEREALTRLNKARSDAKTLLNDSTLSLREAELAERRAYLDREEAIKRFQAAQTDTSQGEDRRKKVQQERDEAILAYDKSVAKVDELSGAEKDARKGIKDGIDIVAKAEDDYRDAQDSRQDAAEQIEKRNAELAQNKIDLVTTLADAEATRAEGRRSALQSEEMSLRAIERAEDNLLFLQIQRTDTASRAEDAMKNLTASAQDFVHTTLRIKDAFGPVRDVVQENLFAKMTRPMENMVNRLLPQLKSGLGTLSTSLGGVFGTFFTALGESFSGGRLETFLSNIAAGFDEFSKAVTPLVNAFTTLSVVGSKFMPQLAGYITDAANRFDAFIAKAAGDGSLEQWIQDGIDGFKDVGGVLKGVYGMFDAIAKASAAADGLTLSKMSDGLQKAADLMNGEPWQSTMKTIFEGARLAMDGVGESIRIIGNMLVTNAPTIKRMLDLMGQILPVITKLFTDLFSDPKVQDGVIKFFEGMLKGVESLDGAVGPVAEAFGAILTLAGKMGEEFGPVLAAALEAIAPHVQRLAEALVPLVTVLAEGLTEAFKNLEPFLVPIAVLLIGIAGGLVAVRAVNNVAGTVNDISKAFRSLRSATQMAGDATRAALPAMKGMSDLIKKHPFVAIVAAVVALVGALIWCYYNVEWFRDGVNGFFGGIKGGAEDLMDFMGKLPGLMTNLFEGLGKRMFASGQALVRGFLQGIKAAAPSLYNALKFVLGNSKDYFPSSPAKKGPFSKRGYTTYSGRAMIRDLGKSMIAEKEYLARASANALSAISVPKAIDLSTVSVSSALQNVNLGLEGSGTTIHNEWTLNELSSPRANALEIMRLQGAPLV